MRGPVTLAKVCSVTCPNHEIGLSLGDGTEDTVTVTKYLVGGLEAFFYYVVCAANCYFEIRGRGAAMVISRTGKFCGASNDFTV